MCSRTTGSGWWRSYDFPEDHWKHLRTTNVVERPVRCGTAQDQRGEAIQAGRERYGADLKLLLVAEKRFRRLDAPHLLKDVFEGRKFEDGKPVSTQQRRMPPDTFTHLLTQPLIAWSRCNRRVPTSPA